jgi:hypothetical protein
MFPRQGLSSAKHSKTVKSERVTGRPSPFVAPLSGELATAYFRNLRNFCAVHKNILDRRSRGFYISLVLRCSETSAGMATKSFTGEVLARSQRLGQGCD